MFICNRREDELLENYQTIISYCTKFYFLMEIGHYIQVNAIIVQVITENLKENENFLPKQKIIVLLSLLFYNDKEVKHDSTIFHHSTCYTGCFKMLLNKISLNIRT